MAWSVCGALAAAFAGLKLGEVLRGRLAGPTFQKALFLVFIALGAANLIWPDDAGMNDAANMQPAAARLKSGCRGHRLREIGTCPR